MKNFKFFWFKFAIIILSQKSLNPSLISLRNFIVQQKFSHETHENEIIPHVKLSRKTLNKIECFRWFHHQYLCTIKSLRKANFCRLRCFHLTTKILLSYKINYYYFRGIKISITFNVCTLWLVGKNLLRLTRKCFP